MHMKKMAFEQLSTTVATMGQSIEIIEWPITTK